MNKYHLQELKIELTRDCPLRCLHCSSNGEPHALESLPSRRVIEILNDFIKLGGKTLAISGGEPLIYKELASVLEFCQSAGLNPSLYTTGIAYHYPNLSPIPGDIVTLLKYCGAKAIFSLQGARPETHDALTQVVGSFETALKSIQLTLSSGICTQVHIVPMSINISEIADIVNLVYSLGVRKVSWLRFVPQGRGAINRDQLRLAKTQLKQLRSVKQELQRIYPDMKIRTGSPFNILCPKSPVECVAATSEIAIRPDGNVVPCDAFKQFVGNYKYNNILKHSLSEVWGKSELLNEVRRIRELRYNSQCKTCSAYSRCLSGCIAQKSIAAGRITNGKDPDCLLDHTEVESEKLETVTIC